MMYLKESFCYENNYLTFSTEFTVTRQVHPVLMIFFVVCHGTEFVSLTAMCSDGCKLGMYVASLRLPYLSATTRFRNEFKNYDTHIIE